MIEWLPFRNRRGVDPNYFFFHLKRAQFCSRCLLRFDPAFSGSRLVRCPFSSRELKETYERKLQVVAVRYPNKTAKEIITKMIGADVARDSLNTSDEITGQQGGRLLASYLHSIKDDASNDFLSSGVNNFLQTQLDKYRMFYPSQKGLLEQALLFLPKLEQLAAAAAAAAAPPPDFGTPAAARPRPGEAGPSAAPPPVEF